MNARLLSIGVAVPPGRISMDESIALAVRMGAKALSPESVAKLTTRTGVRSRGSMVLGDGGGQSLYREPVEAGDLGPGTGARLANATRDAASLGERACRQALDEAGIDPRAVTHIVTASCTVMEAPGFDQGLVERLGIDADARRTHIGFMGCHAAINALAVAHALALANAAPPAVVLVCCVELCSLHMHYTERADQLIANALFADGAAAALVTSGRDSGARSDHLGRAVTLAGFGSRIFRDKDGRDTRDAMGWSIGDHGFSMNLDRRVPELLRAAVPGWVDAMLRPHGLQRRDVGAWAIHPGGPRIVQTIAECLDLKERQRTHAEQDALEVLQSNGNMSSATVLFILRRMREQNRPRPWVALAFGPGLAGEAVVIA